MPVFTRFVKALRALGERFAGRCAECKKNWRDCECEDDE